MVEVFLGLGSNLGNRKANLEKALNTLTILGVKTVKASAVYETEPVGILKQGIFLNCVVMVKTALTPLGLLLACKEAEALLKRKETFRWGPRAIDIDILLYGREVIKNKLLTIPHKEMLKRRFVLLPLADLAPGLKHPLKNKSINELLLDIQNKKRVVLTGKLRWT